MKKSLNNVDRSVQSVTKYLATTPYPRWPPIESTLMIASAPMNCLSEKELRDFSSGRLPADRFERLLVHLDSCQDCQKRSEAAAEDADSFVGALASGETHSPDPILAEPDCQAALYHAAASHPVRFDRVLPPIESLGPYRLLRPLGRGGMGAVYLAEHQRLRRECAIKLLPRERGFNADWLERFEREMQAVASLHHPNIVAATDAGDADGWHYLVMEYLDGLDLASVVRRLRQLDVASAAAIMRDVCKALSALHDAGLVHRDVKPSNVMLTSDGNVKLLDLGLVFDGQLAADMRLTTVGHVMGTLAFAAPEQLSNDEVVDGRADLYGVGATLFQLVAGEPCHTSVRGIAPLVKAKTALPARSLQSVRGDVSNELDQLVARLLQRDANDRPASAMQVAEELDAMAAQGSLKPLATRAIRLVDDTEQSTAAMSAAWPQVATPPPRKPRKRMWLLGGAAAFSLLLAAVVITIKTDDKTVVVETDGDEVKVSVENASPTDTPIATNIKTYKGEPLAYWINMIQTERDVATLGDAMDAIVNLADVDDVDAVSEILISSRRLGGWTRGTSEDSPSWHFMGRFESAIAGAMPMPGVVAISKELSVGNEKSRAACLLALMNFSDIYEQSQPSMIDWASVKKNEQAATQLYEVLSKLTQDPLTDGFDGSGVVQTLIALLANSLDRPMDEAATQYVTTLQQAIVSAADRQNLQERFERIYGEVRDVYEARTQKPRIHRHIPLSALQTKVALELNLDLPSSVAVPSLLGIQEWFRADRYEAFAKRFNATPQEFADETLFWLGTTSSSPAMRRGGGFVRETNTNVAALINEHDALWKETLPLVIENTTRPDLATKLLRGAMTTHNGVYLLTEPMQRLVRECLTLARQRASGQDIDKKTEDKASIFFPPTPPELRSATNTKTYKGKPLDHWISIMRGERDIPTLGDAMDAIVSLADADDVDAVGEILVASRRLGGWKVGGTDDPSRHFMERFQSAFEHVMPMPGATALSKELSVGNAKSRAACLWALIDFGDIYHQRQTQMIDWASAEENKQEATELHGALCSLSQEQLTEELGGSTDLQKLIVLLAIALELPIDDTEKYITSIENTIETADHRSLKERLDRIVDDAMQASPRLDALQTQAGMKLGIELPATVAIPSLLGTQTWFRQDRYKEYEKRLLETPQIYADETLIWLTARGGEPGWVTVADQLNSQETLWKKNLRLIVETTSRPDIADGLFQASLHPLGMSDGRVSELSESMRVLVKECLELAHQRLYEQNTASASPENMKPAKTID